MPADADADAIHPDSPNAFTRFRKLPLPTWVPASCGFRGGSVQTGTLILVTAHFGWVTWAD